MDAPAAAETALQEITVEDGDFFFEDPAFILPGRTRLRYVNVGAEFHRLRLVRLEEGRTVAELLERMSVGEIAPVWASFVDGPNPPKAGGETEACSIWSPASTRCSA